MEKLIEHSGIVERVERNTVFVKIIAGGACGTCRARTACGLGETQEKIVAVTTQQAAEYSPGDAVTVGVRRRMGSTAVLLAYVGALVVLLAALIVAIKVLEMSEGAGALVSLLSVGVYYGCLWLARHKIETNIHFTITKP